MTLYLYLDSRLSIKLPEAGVAGNVRMVDDRYHFFGGGKSSRNEQFLKWPLEDRRYSSNLDSGYNMKAFLATMDYMPRKIGGGQYSI